MAFFKNALVIQRIVVRLSPSARTFSIQNTHSKNLKLLPTKISCNFYPSIQLSSLTRKDQLASTTNTTATINPAATITNKPPPPVTNKIESKLKTSLVIKQRPPLKKKPKKISVQQTTSSFKVKALATANYFDLDGLRLDLQNSGAYELYEIDDKMPTENFLCAGAKYSGINELEPRHIFFFLEGTVVFWNLSCEEQNGILEMLHKHEQNPYPERFVKEESEMMEYGRDNGTENDPNAFHKVCLNMLFTCMTLFVVVVFTNITYLNLNMKPTRVINGHIIFEKHQEDHINDSKQQLLEKYALSDAMSLSVKLGIWEKNLEEFSEQLGQLSDNLKSGKSLKINSEDVLKYLGELLTMRHVVNLDSHFLDQPDFYWDREQLEPIYSELNTYFTIAKRTRLFNDKLNHCIDLMEILKQHLSDRHHVRLEWIIIWLIFVEVLIGLDVFVLLKKLFVYLFGL